MDISNSPVKSPTFITSDFHNEEAKPTRLMIKQDKLQQLQKSSLKGKLVMDNVINPALTYSAFTSRFLLENEIVQLLNDSGMLAIETRWNTIINGISQMMEGASKALEEYRQELDKENDDDDNEDNDDDKEDEDNEEPVGTSRHQGLDDDDDDVDLFGLGPSFRGTSNEPPPPPPTSQLDPPVFINNEVEQSHDTKTIDNAIKHVNPLAKQLTPDKISSVGLSVADGDASKGDGGDASKGDGSDASGCDVDSSDASGDIGGASDEGDAVDARNVGGLRQRSKPERGKGPLEYKKSDEEDTSTPLDKKSKKPRSEQQMLLAAAQARVEERKKMLDEARAPKVAAKLSKPKTMEEDRLAWIEMEKALQEKRRRIESKKKAQEVDLTSQSPEEPREKEAMDITSHLEHLKKIKREKHLEEQQATTLAREKIKESLKRTVGQAVLEPQECQRVVVQERYFQKERAEQANEEIANLRTALQMVTQERDRGAKENENLLQDFVESQQQLTRKEAQCHELIKNEKKLKEQLGYEDARFQRINASYNTVKTH
ncbi:hypothetical protein L7F22_026139 [Adiantum nelumboides]|nr:hypothetical protein [Adiantum nelumboides]